MNICSVRYKHCWVPTFELHSLGSCIDLAFRMEAAWCFFLQQARVKGRENPGVGEVSLQWQRLPSHHCLGCNPQTISTGFKCPSKGKRPC